MDTILGLARPWIFLGKTKGQTQERSKCWMQTVDLEVSEAPTHVIILIPGVLDVTPLSACCQASLVSREREQGYPVYCPD